MTKDSVQVAGIDGSGLPGRTVASIERAIRRHPGGDWH